jgi:sulfate permease, SulP family
MFYSCLMWAGDSHLARLTVSMRIDDDELGWNAFQLHYVVMWLPALLLAVLLRLITHKFHHQLVFPVCTSCLRHFFGNTRSFIRLNRFSLLDFLVIPAIFYIVIAAAGFNLGELRKAGWIFDMATDSTSERWYTFYTYFDFSKVRIEPLLSTMPTQMAL